MSEPADSKDRPAASTRSVEAVVAVLVFLFGALVIYDSARLGRGWAADGPQAGYFPFYIGLLICISAAVVLWRALKDRALAAKPFVLRGQLVLILRFLVPSIVYVVLIDLIGIYVASAAFITYFMIALGGYSVARTLPIALGVTIVFFVVFEIWFHVPLPKGPFEALIGFG